MDAGPPRRENWRGTGTVLVVDDEPRVRQIAAEILERMGLSVMMADGSEAVDVFRQRHDEIAIVLLEFTMPRMNGAGTYTALREICADVPVILSSGSATAVWRDSCHPEVDLGLVLSCERPTRQLACPSPIYSPTSTRSSRAKRSCRQAAGGGDHPFRR